MLDRNDVFCSHCRKVYIFERKAQAYLQMQKDLESLLMILEDEQEDIHQDFLDIGNKHYKSGYGFIAMGVQEKYLFVKKPK